MSVSQILDLMCNELIISRLKIRKKENHQSVLSFLFLWFRNVLIFYLCTSSAVDSAVSDLIALSVINDHSRVSSVIFIMLVYMKNLSSSVQHQKIAINVYCKSVSVKRCKKCVERNVECIKIKFSIEKNSKKCAFMRSIRSKLSIWVVSIIFNSFKMRIFND